MDVNRTRVHLVYGERDWMTSKPDAAKFDYERGSLILRRFPFVFPQRRSESPLTPDDRRGAGRDRYGNWYWISADRYSIRFRGHEAETSQHFWAATDRPVRCHRRDGEFFSDCAPSSPSPRALAGLAVTADHYLLVGTLDDPALLVFELHDGGPPLELRWPGRGAFTPFDLTPTVQGGAWILDRTNRTYLGVDRYFNFIGAPVTGPVERPAFTSVDPGASPAPAGVVHGSGVKPFPLTEIAEPIAIESLPDGSVLVLDAGGGSASSVHRVLNGKRLGHPAMLVLAGGITAAIPLRAHDLTFVPNDQKQPGVEGVVFVTVASGNQTFQFPTLPAGQFIVTRPGAAYFPMRFAAGKGLVGTPDGPYYDLDDRWIALAEQPLPHHEVSATLQLPRVAEQDEPAGFDGGQARCVWHRLLVDACIPPGTSIRIESRAAEELDALAPDSATPWQEEPPLYLRRDGSEIPYYRTPLPGGGDHTGTWELLFQRAVGRFLQLRVTLTGSGRGTPRVHALRVYYPRFSYLREYLPAVYREDEPSASFLDRFLANIEGFYTAVEGRIEHAQALFDPRTVPAEYLEWLATWFGVTLDPAWDDHRRRLFLAHAHAIFLERGTLRGVTRAVRLALDPCADESAFTDPCPCGCGESSPFQVRITEGFLSGSASAQAPGSGKPGTQEEIRIPSARWTPSQGASVLHAQFAASLKNQYQTIERLNESWSSLFNDFSEVRFSATSPTHDIRRRDWSAFARTQLAVPYYEARVADEPLLRRFLERRYPQVTDLRRTWGFEGFDQVHLPTELPSGAALGDWIEFVSSVLPANRRAHYFTVLIPADISDSEETHTARLELARRVASAVKPAHTEFDVALYWAMFRVGEVRVGLDTVLGHGSRFVSMVLGRTPLANGYLTAQTPGGEIDRFITGRDPLKSRVDSRWSVS